MHHPAGPSLLSPGLVYLSLADSAPNVFADKKPAIYKQFRKLAATMNQISTHPGKRWTL